MKSSGTEKQEGKDLKDDLRLAIQKRIEELTNEIQNLIESKQRYQESMLKVDTRLTQQIGAIEELNNLIKPKEDK
jgi:CII-binding regulator of phage lambda lysogenization HflD